jgi:SAM-dependent methyltransferase
LATLLAPHFEEVIATDLSDNQLKQATSIPNIIYRKERAETSSLSDKSVALITVAQAVHWFDFEAFYAEVRRVLQPNGIVALIGYPLFTTDDDALNHKIYTLYYDLLGSTYWDAERKYLDDRYRTIPFPFREVEFPSLSMQICHTAASLIGYLETWSAIHKYRKLNPNSGTLDRLLEEITEIVASIEPVDIRFDLVCRVGKLEV